MIMCNIKRLEKVKINRGAGQGEPDGPLKAAVTIGHKVGQARQDISAANGDNEGGRAVEGGEVLADR